VSPVPAHAPLQQAPHGSAAGLGDPAGTQQRPQTHCAAPDGFRQSPSLAHGEGGTPDSIGLTTQAQPPRAWHSRAPEQQAVRHSSWLKAPQDVPTARQVGCGQPPLQQRRMPPCVSAPHSMPSGRLLRHLPRFFRWHGLHLRFPAMTGWARGSPAARSASPERNPTTARRPLVGPRDRIRQSKRPPSMRFSSGRSSRGAPGDPHPQLSGGDAGARIPGFAAGGIDGVSGKLDAGTAAGPAWLCWRPTGPGELSRVQVAAAAAPRPASPARPAGRLNHPQHTPSARPVKRGARLQRGSWEYRQPQYVRPLFPASPRGDRRERPSRRLVPAPSRSRTPLARVGLSRLPQPLAPGSAHPGRVHEQARSLSMRAGVGRRGHRSVERPGAERVRASRRVDAEVDERRWSPPPNVADGAVLPARRDMRHPPLSPG
jgi:hypothetical protein